MALLRNAFRLWTRSTRTFSSIQPQKGVRLTPRQQWLQSDLTLNDRLRNNEDISPVCWTEIRKEFLARTDLMISESTVDVAVVRVCRDNHKPEKAMEYLEHLWDSSGELNVASMAAYLKLCYLQRPNETQKRYLLAMYDRIREKYPVMDAATAESCIMGLSCTERYRECEELMDMIELSCKPRTGSYSAIIRSAFDNDDPETGWKYLREGLMRLNLGDQVYTSYLNYCTRKFAGAELEEEIGKMFRLWGELDVRPYVEVIAEYENVLKERGWSTARTTIRDLGSCCSCAHTLSAMEVSPEQFRKLTDAVRERVIIGEDVYRKTTPAELKEFLDFIENTKPYDVVIDGLNVSYTAKDIQARSRPDGSQLTNVVRLCVEMGKRVLVLGRKHMWKWPKLDIKYIRAHGTLFLAHNSSADDPYMLYATLIKGPKTMFVSKDLMRQHKFLIEDFELMKIFKYWQLAHQFYPVAIPTQRGLALRLRPPPSYLPVAQGDDDGWHVPYTVDPSLQPPLIYEPPRTWVCFRKSPPTSKDRPNSHKNL